MDARIRRIARIYDLTDAKAKDLIKKTDKRRSSYYNYYSNKKWGAAESYNICLDSSLLGIDGTAKAIEQLVELKENITEESPTYIIYYYYLLYVAGDSFSFKLKIDEQEETHLSL